jgi:PAS domain S-box-containing protein
MTSAAQEAHIDFRNERDRFVAFSFAAADLLLELGRDGRIRFVSGAARAMTGSEPEALLGQPFEQLLAEDDRRFVAVLLERLGVGNRLEPVIVRLKAQGRRPVATVLGGCRLPSQGESFFLSLATPRHSPVEEPSLSQRNPSTGLLERESFERMAAGLARHRELSGRGARLTLISLVGVDDLRVRAGAEATEAFLREVGAFLRAVSINGDGAGQIADDKYGVIHGAAVDAASVGDRLADLSRQTDPTGQGVDVERSTVDLAIDLMTEEDAARAITYAIGRFAEETHGSFEFDTLQDVFRTILRDTVSRIGTLKGTVAENRFDVAFQPIIDLRSRAIHHYEMLARVEGAQSPHALVTFAEGVGIIEEFDLAICQRAIDILQQKGSEAIAIAVNLSGRSLESGLFAETLLALLKPHQALGPRLLFELTESTRIGALEQANSVIQALRARGHRFALDDFGAGASSFPYLHALTVDFVKIDGAYVRRVLSSPRDAAILKSMVSLCRDLRVETIAEMVETEAQAKELETLGVDYGQGYYFGRPQPRPLELERKSPRNVARQTIRQGAAKSWG